MHAIRVMQRDRKSQEESEMKPQRRKNWEIKEKEGDGVQERGIEREEGNGFFK